MIGSPLLTPDACARIERAVGRAEAGTAGEIVVMVAARAGQYRSVAHVAALVAGLILPWPLLVLTSWSTGAILLAQAALVAALLAAGLSERLRVALTPRRVRRSRARDAARRAFWSRGLGRTRGRTGILLYLSLAEHHAEIVADQGILDRVGAEHWTATLADLTTALRRGEAEAGLLRAVERMGAELARHVPAGHGDPDELPNHVIVVE
ncbi:TPM domain-containing protein [Methylobacterium sp. E-041]|uniref:TPM domain-containing protein n=1 Tax=Methylobacterium sp. E-041 TaxID=2836573 RepID=UPI001FBB9E62|nr:TPM domain-containing protein [Methylobacterium sp. E-041]MCJ2106688.1 TPM domain-containing protein [Methylobacterium sp. E-041]